MFKQLKFFIMGLLVIVLSACHSASNDELVIQKNNASSNAPPTQEVFTVKQQEERNNLAAGYNVSLGLGYLQDGDMNLAKQKLLNALKLSPNNAMALDAMAYYLEKTDNMKQAEVYYKKAISKASKVDYGRAVNNYGTFLCRQSRYQESLPYFMKAVDDPSYTDIAGAYENAGLCALEIPSPEQAEIYFKKAVANDPRRVDSLFELAKISADQGDYASADRYLKLYFAKVKPNPETLKFQTEIQSHLTV